MAAYPIDYYWLWTPEGWTWEDVKQEHIDATLADFQAIQKAAEAVDAPFQLATCGWVLGPPQAPALFDGVLPKSWPLSCINRNVGHDPVEPGFAAVSGRPAVGDSLAGRRPGDDHSSVVGGPHAQGRGRRAALRLRRSAGNSLAHADSGTQRVGAGQGGLVAGRLEDAGGGRRSAALDRFV